MCLEKKVVGMFTVIPSRDPCRLSDVRVWCWRSPFLAIINNNRKITAAVTAN